MYSIIFKEKKNLVAFYKVNKYLFNNLTNERFTNIVTYSDLAKQTNEGTSTLTIAQNQFVDQGWSWRWFIIDKWRW